MNAELILARLGVQGVTLVGGDSDFSGFLPMLNASGMLDASIVPGLGDLSIVAADVPFDNTYAGHTLSNNVQDAIASLDTGCLKVAALFTDISIGLRATAFGNIKVAASETVTGVAELATQSEVNTGSDTVRVVTPATVAARYLKKNANDVISGIVTAPAPTQPDQLVIRSYVDSAIASALGSANLTTGNLVWVDAVNGNNTTGLRGRLDKPFATLIAARTAASSGDLIVVQPGAYTTNSSTLLKSGVNWHFAAGAIVTHGGTTTAIFDDSTNGTNAAVTSRISGQGTFIGTSSSQPILVVNNASTIFFEAYNVTCNLATAFAISAGTEVVLKLDSMVSVDGVLLNLSGGNTDLQVRKLSYTYSTGSGVTYPLVISGGTNQLRVHQLTSNKGGINFNGGTNYCQITKLANTVNHSITCNNGTTVYQGGDIVNTDATNSTSRVIDYSQGTLKLTGVSLTNTSTNVNSTGIYITTTNTGLQLRQAEISTNGTYAIDSNTTGSLALRGFATVNKPAASNVTVNNGLLDIL